MLQRFVLRTAATALVLVPSFGAVAQTTAAVSGAPARASAPPNGTKVLNLEDYGRWNRISGTSISNDGKWMTYVLTPNEGGSPTLHIKPIDGGDEIQVGLGGGGGGGRGGRGGGRGGGGGGGPSFSDDSRWITYTVVPSGRGGGGRGAGGRGGQPPAPGGRGAAPATQPQTTPSSMLVLRNLATGDTTSFTGVASSQFSPGAKYLVLRMTGGGGGAAADIVLHDLASGTNRNIGNVGQFSFNDDGSLLAYTVSAPEKLGNGVFLLNPATGVVQTLASGTADFESMSWNSAGNGISALRGVPAPGLKHRNNVLLAWTGVGSGTPQAFTFDPTKNGALPQGYVLSEYTAPRWSPDGSKFFVGIKQQEPEIPAADSIRANVDVWHWKDEMPQSRQIVQINQLRRATIPGVIHVSSGRFVQLGDDDMPSVTVAANNNVGIGRHDAAYRGEITWGASRADFHRVDIATGQRTLIDKSLSRTYGTSPDSKWYLYLKNKQVRAFNLENGTAVTLDASGVPTKNYVNEEDDHAYELPLWGVGGWTRDGRAVLLYDKFDIWSVPLDGSKATNLTQGVGRRQEIQFRITSLGGGGGGGGRGGRGGGGGAASDSGGIDMTKPITLSAYGERTKKRGFWTVTAGQAPKEIIYLDKNIGGIQKADDANRMLFTRQDNNEYPDVWVSDTMFSNPRKLTDANPILKEYAWSPGRVLIDYTCVKGTKLQASLMLPAGYEQGKRYPMLVEFYEKRSQNHNNFSQPGYSNSPQLSTYASNGYLVMEPDVVYEIGRPGTSAVDCITAAVKKAIDLGYAQPGKIGLHGHSWSGYQSSYIVTQTDIFAAVVTGAPPTNLLSFYNTLYKSSGTVQQGITTVGQVRMGANVTPFNNTRLYLDQSPIFHVDKIRTPFMILHGMEDGAVDYVEGLQFFNAARAAGKQVILLSYPGEAHNLTNRDNQKDFTIRMKQFFDHYLMDKPVPKWMAEGLPQVNKGGAIR